MVGLEATSDEAARHASYKPASPPPEVPGGHADGDYLSRWRKPWPYGPTDSGDNDEDVLHLDSKRRHDKKEKDVIKYEWTLDSDIVDSWKHLGYIEKLKDKQLDYKSYWDRGYEILNSGDRAIKSYYI